MRCVVLFDLDGTLVSGPPGRRSAGIEAMRRAIAAVAGTGEAVERVEFHGNTDRRIARALLEAAGHDSSDRERVDDLLDHYVEALAELVNELPYRPLGAPKEILAELEGDGAIVGMGTGNVRRGARIKLASAGLDGVPAFERGGFGDDGERREDVIAIGASRCDAARRLPLVVVGDTPHDIAAAHAAGGRCVAVTTGRFGAASLAQNGADAVVRTIDGALLEAVRRLAIEGP